MAEIIKHECGIAMVRLLKPLAYYQKKYGSYLYGLNKLYLLMEKVLLKMNETPSDDTQRQKAIEEAQK